MPVPTWTAGLCLHCRLIAHPGPDDRLLFKSLQACYMQARATPLAPGEWRAMLCEAQPAAGAAAGAGGGAAGRPRPVVLDVRNAYEWDAGHFSGAERPLEVPRSPTRRFHAVCCVAVFIISPARKLGFCQTLQHEAVHCCAGPFQPDADGGARGRGAGAAAVAAQGHARHDVLHRRHPLRHLLHLPAPEGVPYILHRVGCSAMHGTLHKVWCGDSFSGAAHAASGPACNSYVKGSLIMSLG